MCALGSRVRVSKSHPSYDAIAYLRTIPADDDNYIGCISLLDRSKGWSITTLFLGAQHLHKAICQGIELLSEAFVLEFGEGEFCYGCFKDVGDDELELDLEIRCRIPDDRLGSVLKIGATDPFGRCFLRVPDYVVSLEVRTGSVFVKTSIIPNTRYPIVLSST
jgi:hypothetical protein